MTLILVVEDEPAIAGVLQLLLEDAGYAVRTAADGQAALTVLTVLAEARPALVVCDLMMPHMTGVELQQRLAADPGWQTIPVLFMSAGAGPPQPVAPNVVGFVSKPFDFDHLLQLIQPLVGPPDAG